MEDRDRDPDARGVGTFILFRGHSLGQVALGAYFLSLAINYVPLLLYAINIARRKSARAEVADERAQGQRLAMREYRRQSLLLLLPLVVPAMAFTQERRKARVMKEGAT